MDVVDNNPVVPANTVTPQPNLTPETPKTPEPTQKKKTPRKILTIGLIIILIFVAILLTLLAFTYLERNRYGSATINNKNTTDSNIVSSPVSYTNDSGTYTFQSTNYDVVFKYPTSMGNAKVETREAPFNTSNEYVVFSKSSLEITYWGDEVRGFGSEYTLAAPIEDLTTKDNKPCQLLIRKTGKEYDIFASCYLDETYSTYKSVHFLQEAISMSELETAKSNVKSIIASLSFDISDLNSDQSVSGSETKTFQSTRYDVTFNYPSSMGEYSVEYIPDYFNDEKIAFSNSIIELHYWRFEGSTGGTYEEQIIPTKDGKICSVKTFGASIMASCPGDITIYTAGTFSGSDSNTVKSYQDDIRTIITSLEYTR